MGQLHEYGRMKPRQSEAAKEALRARRAYEAYQWLRIANGLPPDPLAGVLLVPQKVKQ